MNVGIPEIAMMVAGGLVGGAGVWLLLFKRRKAGDAGGRGVAGLTEPTRITLAVVGVIAGYHLIVWALPPHVSAVQFPRSRWYIWILIGICASVLTFVLDRYDRHRASTPSPRDRERP